MFHLNSYTVEQSVFNSGPCHHQCTGRHLVGDKDIVLSLLHLLAGIKKRKTLSEFTSSVKRFNIIIRLEANIVANVKTIDME